jgi:hypothetical protein
MQDGRVNYSENSIYKEWDWKTSILTRQGRKFFAFNSDNMNLNYFKKIPQ